MQDRSPVHARGPLVASLALGLVVATVTLLPRPLYPEPPGDDKLYHMLAFGLLAAPLALRSLRLAALAAFATILFGAAIEALQPLVGRDAEMGDLIADATGAVLGAAAAAAIGRRLRRSRRP